MTGKRGKPGSKKTSAHDASGVAATLPPWKAFVVQFSRDTDSSGDVFSGRVEHLNSGHRARFLSAEELIAVLTRLLNEYGER